MHIKFLSKWYIKSGHENDLLYTNLLQPEIQYQKKSIGFTVYSFRSKNDSCVTFKNVENVGATELIKDEAKITGHRGVCCNPCNWDGRYWMPTMVGDP